MATESPAVERGENVRRGLLLNLKVSGTNCGYYLQETCLLQAGQNSEKAWKGRV